MSLLPVEEARARILAGVRPLPAEPYVVGQWELCRAVGADYHVVVDGHYYSVPSALAHTRVDVFTTPTLVSIFQRGERVASHPRSPVKGGHTTLPEHMTPSHRAVVERTPERLRAEAAAIGVATAAYVDRLIDSRQHVAQGVRAAVGVIRLSGRHGAAVHQADQPPPVQGGQVAADGLGRHPEVGARVGAVEGAEARADQHVAATERGWMATVLQQQAARFGAGLFVTTAWHHTPLAESGQFASVKLEKTDRLQGGVGEDVEGGHGRRLGAGEAPGAQPLEGRLVVGRRAVRAPTGGTLLGGGQLGTAALAHPRTRGGGLARPACGGGPLGRRAGTLTEDPGRLVEEPRDPPRPLRPGGARPGPRQVQHLAGTGDADVHQSPLLLDLLRPLGHHDRQQPVGAAGEEDDVAQPLLRHVPHFAAQVLAPRRGPSAQTPKSMADSTIRLAPTEAWQTATLPLRHPEDFGVDENFYVIPRRAD